MVTNNFACIYNPRSNKSDMGFKPLNFPKVSLHSESGKKKGLRKKGQGEMWEY